MRFATKPSRREMLLGCIYLTLYLAVLPRLIPLLALFLLPQLNAAQINFIFFAVDFAAITAILFSFLCRSLRDARKAPGPAIWYAILGYLGTQTLGSILVRFILRIEPEFANINDMAINSLIAENFVLMAIGTVILAPITEELLFRGLVFRGLYDRSPLAAYLISMVLFSSIHITGYIGHYPPKMLVLCFIQYLPAAYCLNFAYRRSGTIAAPILTHMLLNLAALSASR